MKHHLSDFFRALPRDTFALLYRGRVIRRLELDGGTLAHGSGVGVRFQVDRVGVRRQLCAEPAEERRLGFPALLAPKADRPAEVFFTERRPYRPLAARPALEPVDRSFV